MIIRRLFSHIFLLFKFLLLILSYKIWRLHLNRIKKGAQAIKAYA